MQGLFWQLIFQSRKGTHEPYKRWMGGMNGWMGGGNGWMGGGMGIWTVIAVLVVVLLVVLINKVSKKSS
jgi:hypothetical protein